jgi:hypothetical protein
MPADREPAREVPPIAAPGPATAQTAPAPARGVARPVSAAASAPVDPDVVLELQRTAGNRSTTRWLLARRAARKD